MFSFLFRIVLIPLIVLSFWFSFEMSIIILIIYGLLEIILFRTASIKVKPTNELELTSYEEEIFSKYYVVFKFPAASRDYSTILATIQFSTFIFTPLFLFKGLFIPAIVLGFNFWLAGIIAAKFNPILYLGEDIKKGNTTYLLEYEAIQSIGRKINGFQKEQSNKNGSTENASQENKIDTYEFPDFKNEKLKITVGYSDDVKADIYWDDIVASKNNITHTHDGVNLELCDSNYDPEGVSNFVNKICPKCGGVINRFYFLSKEVDGRDEYSGAWMEVCFKCKKVLYFDLDFKE